MTNSGKLIFLGEAIIKRLSKIDLPQLIINILAYPGVWTLTLIFICVPGIIILKELGFRGASADSLIFVLIVMLLPVYLTKLSQCLRDKLRYSLCSIGSWVYLYISSVVVAKKIMRYVGTNITHSQYNLHSGNHGIAWDNNLQFAMYGLYFICFLTVLITLHTLLRKYRESEKFRWFAGTIFVMCFPSYQSWHIYKHSSNRGYGVELVAPTIMSFSPFYAPLSIAFAIILYNLYLTRVIDNR